MRIKQGRPIVVAKTIGQDLARTNYQVDRAAHRWAPGTERDAPATQNAIVHEAETAHAGLSVLGFDGKILGRASVRQSQ